MLICRHNHLCDYVSNLNNLTAATTITTHHSIDYHKTPKAHATVPSDNYNMHEMCEL